jgi:hypothetical protein
MRRPLGLRRRLTFLLTALAAVLLGMFLPASAWAAPGDNGDVKIHASTTPVGDQSDDTHVCEFYLDAFNFDTIQTVSWHINQQPPTGTAQVLSGSLVLTNGAGHTGNMQLPAGHYKLTWTFVGEHGDAKSKVFWSTCPEGSPSASASASASPSTSSGGGNPTGGSSPGGGGSMGQGVGPNGAPLSPTLAHTGVALAPWVLAGLGLTFTGLWLARRKPGRRMR